MTKPKKTDLRIEGVNDTCFIISKRKRFLLFFNRWIQLTYLETEGSIEQPLEFKTHQAASDFIDTIT